MSSHAQEIAKRMLDVIVSGAADDPSLPAPRADSAVHTSEHGSLCPFSANTGWVSSQPFHSA
jgi:hypothetical protein